MRISFLLALMLITLTSSQVIQTLLKTVEKPYNFLDEENSSYQVSKSQSLFYYSQISKCDLQTIKDWNCGFFCTQHPGMSEIQTFHNPAHEGQGFCGYNRNENQIIISIRSTQNVNNFLQDQKWFKTNFGCQGCQVHLGFYETYLDIKDGLISCAQKLIKSHTGAQVTVTGHSLGGAISTLIAVDMYQLGVPVHNVYTFGSPRVGNQEFSAYVQNKIPFVNTFRVTHNQDPIVHYPPSAFGYQHVTQEVWFNSDSSSFKTCDLTNGEDLTCANSAWPITLNDHFNYHGNTLNCGDALYNFISYVQDVTIPNN